MTQLKQTEVVVRCAYCGLLHRFIVRVLEAKNGELEVDVRSLSEGCDVMDAASIIEHV